MNGRKGAWNMEEKWIEMEKKKKPQIPHLIFEGKCVFSAQWREQKGHNFLNCVEQCGGGAGDG
jgi:hypothetical protein